MTNTTMLWTIIVLAIAVLVLVLAASAARRRAHLRSAELQRRFGPEYDRAVREFGSPGRAERELSARTRRVAHLRFQELSDVDRTRFESAWNRIQTEFVDDPGGAVGRADALIMEVMRARGYPADGYDQRVRDLSVEHPEVVQHYRAARALSESRRAGPVETEELRQAVVHYRVMFADLLHERGSMLEPEPERREPSPRGDDRFPHVPH
jgi:hypothetical protein